VGAVSGGRRRPLTASVEDYLKAVYDLERDGDAAVTSDLAVRLGVAPASVTGMVRRLAEQQLLTYTPYRGVRLTATGGAQRSPRCGATG
jgi:DtxR family Mn-dependent transcriptional regulator